MRLSACFVAIVLTCIGVLGPASAEPSASDATVRAKIVTVVEGMRKLYGGRTPVPGVLIGVWDGHGGGFVRAFGYADLAKRRPLTASDHFRIGSNTKTFVVSVLLQLVDEGKLRLDDPLSRFNFGVTIPNARNITVREVAEMRSGLFEASDTPQLQQSNVKPDTVFRARSLIALAVKQKPYFAPGRGYRYSNTNYLILGLIDEEIGKSSLTDLIRARLLEPHHLTQTSVPATMAMPDPWAHGYGLDKQKNWEDVSNTIPVSLMGAAGDMISDMADMKRWTQIYVTGKDTAAATHRARLSCVNTGEGNLSFGLGIGCSAGWFGYTGGLPGYNTAIYYYPASGTTIVSWVTLQAGTPFPGVANGIFRGIAKIMTPSNVPFVKQSAEGSKSGL